MPKSVRLLSRLSARDLTDLYVGNEGNDVDWDDPAFIGLAATALLPNLEELHNNGGGCNAAALEMMTAKDLGDLATKIGISTIIEEAEVAAGYVGKPKGMLQVAWERGLIDADNVKKYKSKQLSREELKVIELSGNTSTDELKFNLRYILDQCDDFKSSPTQLEATARALGGDCVFKLKCHPELAGEGIEYCWGRVKYVFRKSRSALPESTKINHDAFMKLVDECLSTSGEASPMCKKRAL